MGLPDHHCPGCGTPQSAFPRYPWYFCDGCLARATDGDGAVLQFSNTGFSGGLSWCHAGSRDWHHDVIAVRCLINGRPVTVTEARFGGVVAQPCIDASGTHGVDLTRPKGGEGPAGGLV